MTETATTLVEHVKYTQQGTKELTQNDQQRANELLHLTK